jgi:orotate phosphoribosyltransferase-like protein
MGIVKQIDNPRHYGLDAGYYLSYYFKAHSDKEDFTSQKLLAFKDGLEPWTSKWIAIARNLNWSKFHCDLIIRVLNSEETGVTSSTSLDRLGVELSGKGIAAYVPSCLYKIRPTRPLKFLKREERFDEINEVYRYKQTSEKCSSILLLDDILTTGTSIREIRRAVEQVNGPTYLALFVLGKTYDSWHDGDVSNTEIEAALRPPELTF